MFVLPFCDRKPSVDSPSKRARNAIFNVFIVVNTDKKLNKIMTVELSLKVNNSVPIKVDTMAVDGLSMLGAKISAVVLLI